MKQPGELQADAAAMADPAPPAPSAKLLSASSSAGSGSSRASKRRSRATVKPPITVLSADKSTFRDLVQNLTGVPNLTNRAPPDPSLLWRAICNLSQPLINARAWPPAPPPPISSLPTLDTSSALLNLLNSLYSTSHNDPSMRSNSDLDMAAQAAAYEQSHQSHLSFLKSLQASINSTPPSLLGDPMQPVANFPSNFPSSLDINALLSDQDNFAPVPLPPLGGSTPHASPHQSQEATAPASTADTTTTTATAAAAAAATTTATTTATATTNSFNLSLAEVEHLNKLRQAAELESLIMFHKNKDSWPSKDHQHAGAANSVSQHSPPKIEVAHSAC